MGGAGKDPLRHSRRRGAHGAQPSGRGVAVDGERDHPQVRPHLLQQSGADGYLPRFQVHPEPGGGVFFHQGLLSRTVSEDPGKSEERPVGDHGQYLGGSGYQPRLRREFDPPAPLRQGILLKGIRRVFRYLLAAGLLRLHGGAAADHRPLGHEIFLYLQITKQRYQ